jgi:hypothetical protein
MIAALATNAAKPDLRMFALMSALTAYEDAFVSAALADERLPVQSCSSLQALCLVGGARLRSFFVAASSICLSPRQTDLERKA